MLLNEFDIAEIEVLWLLWGVFHERILCFAAMAG